MRISRVQGPGRSRAFPWADPSYDADSSPRARLGAVDFYSAYAHGFARVAACTVPVTIADPDANARAVLAEVRACHEDGVAVAVFPELSLCGYSIDDLFLQDTLLASVEDAVAQIVAAALDLRPVAV